MTLTLQEIATRVDCPVAEVLDATIAAQCGPWADDAGQVYVDPIYLKTQVKLFESSHWSITRELRIDLCREKLRRLAFQLDVEPGEIVGRKGVAA